MHLKLNVQLKEMQKKILFLPHLSKFNPNKGNFPFFNIVLSYFNFFPFLNHFHILMMMYNYFLNALSILKSVIFPYLLLEQ